MGDSSNDRFRKQVEHSCKIGATRLDEIPAEDDDGQEAAQLEEITKLQGLLEKAVSEKQELLNDLGKLQSSLRAAEKGRKDAETLASGLAKDIDAVHKALLASDDARIKADELNDTLMDELDRFKAIEVEMQNKRIHTAPIR